MKETTAAAVVGFVETAQKKRNKYRNFALRFVHNRDAAEELISESFKRLWEKRDEVDFENIEAYFYTSLRYACLNWLRNRQTQFKIRNEIYDATYRLLKYDIATLEKFDPNLIYANEIRDIMHRQLNRMPELTRMVFLDSRFNDLSYDEIAGKYGVTIFKVKREIYTATHRLRTALQDYLPPVLVVLLIALTCL